MLTLFRSSLKLTRGSALSRSTWLRKKAKKLSADSARPSDFKLSSHQKPTANSISSVPTFDRISSRSFTTTFGRDDLGLDTYKDKQQERKLLVDTHARAAVEKIYRIMQHSKDLEFQRRRINRHLISCLPLSTDLSYLAPMYFNDVTKDNELIQQLEDVITSSVQTDLQSRCLVNLVQASGAGKSHLGIQYAKLHGGIFISFADTVHKNFLNKAQSTIQNLLPKQPSENTASCAEEMEYLKTSIRIMSLIPLTFMEFASSFFPIAREYFHAQNQSLDDTALEQQVREAFLRATLDTEGDALLELFQSNVQMYHGNENSYTLFFNKTVANAKQEKITVIFYDEVHLLADICRGLFCHAPGQDYTQTEIMERLRFERRNGGKDIEAHSFSRSTSLMYLQVLAMEELTRKTIGSVTSSSSYSAVLYQRSDGSAFSRGRLTVTHFAPYEKDEKRLNRAVDQLVVAFGPDVKQELKKHEFALKNLSSRSAYLWNLFTKIKDYPTLAETISIAINRAEAAAQDLANGYLERLSKLDVPKDIREELESTSIKIWVGEQTIELSQPTHVMAARKSAIVTEEVLKDDIRDMKLTQSFSARVFDPYIQQQMIKSVSLDHVRYNAIENAGQAGEYYCQAQLLLKYSKQKVQDIKGPAGVLSTSPCANLTLPELMLPKNLTTLGILTEDYEIIERFPEFHSLYYQPGTALHPDAIVHLLEDVADIHDKKTPNKKPAGLLLIQSKNREDIMSPSGLVKALASLEPSNFYSGAKIKRRKWAAVMKSKKLQKIHWVRLLYSRGFSASVTNAVEDYNASPAGKKYPIILMAPPSEDKPSRPDSLAPITISQQKDTSLPKNSKLLKDLMTMHFDGEKYAAAFMAYSPSLAEKTIAGLLGQFKKAKDSSQ